VELNRVIFPYLFFVALAALAMGILNCFHVFGLPAATPFSGTLRRSFFPMALVYRHFHSPAMSLAAGVLVGGVLQFLIQVPLLVQEGNEVRFRDFVHAPGNPQRGAADDSAAVRDRRGADQSAGGYAVCHGQHHAKGS
jgi:putative peptidoglycan lipid II flippase